MSLAHDKWQNLKTVEGVDGGGEYNIVNPHSMYLGKSYSDYAIDWFNWLLSANYNDRNSGPVVFLTSKGIPDKSTPAGRNLFDLLGVSGYTSSATNSPAVDPNAYPPTLYINQPHIRIGSNRLQIFEDQAVFVPIVTSYDIADAPYKDWGYMQDNSGMMIDNGDNPPDAIQLTINNESIVLPPDLPMTEFRVATPIFMTVVPDAPYGTSLKDFLEESPISPGSYPSMVNGYFIMLKLKEGRYWVHSWASAGREIRGPYFSELLYQIEVSVRPRCVPHHRITVTRPAQFQGVANLLAIKMKADGQLTNPEAERFKLIQDDVNKNISQSNESSVKGS